MRRLLFILLTLATLSAAAQGVPSWVEETHDFGTFSSALKKVTCVMKVVNTGDTALLITRVQPNCGCTVAEFSHNAIQPGDTGYVKLTYSARDIPGRFEKKALVYTNGQPRKSVLTITGNVIGTPEAVADRYPNPAGPVRLSSKALPLGEMNKGESRNAYISGYNTSSDTMLVTATLGNKATTHQHVLPDTVVPGGLFIVSVYYTSGAAPEWGLNVDTVKVSAHGMHSDEAGNGMFLVTAQVQENFSKLSEKDRQKAPSAELSTDKVNFEIVAPNAPVERTFTITNKGKSDLIIRRLFIPEGSHVTATASKMVVKKGKSVPVTVTLDATACPKSVLNTTLTVITNDPTTPVTTLRLVGAIQ